MKPSEGQHPHSRPSYLGVGITYPERDEPQETDDIRTNLSEKFLLFGDAESDTTQKSTTDSKENMNVYLRVRPFTASELEQNESQDCVSLPDACSVLVKAPQSSQASRLSEKGGGSVAQKFTFTHVFGPETSQSQFFEGTIKKQVIDFMKGQNRLIFTYGVTNAGKTFTFQGTKFDAGILPRSMDMLFNTIEGKVYSKMDIKPHRCRDYIRLTKEQMRTEAAFKNGVLRHTKEVDPQCSIRSNNSRTSEDTTELLTDDGLSNYSRAPSDFEERLRESEGFTLDSDESTKFSVWVSFCEIYNECIYDLMDPVTGDKFYKRKTLRLAQDIKGFSFVKDLQWIQVSDAKEACRILALGKKFQSIAFTKLNSSSSRSHSIFTVRLLKIEDGDVPRVVRVSELALCDLAGSERCTKTQNEGERLKESGNINTSLLILGKCINALKNSQQSKIQQHVPFRESKLTHYLQSFFSGKGKVCMIVNISQSASAYDETLNVLKFSAVAQKVLILESSQASETSQGKSAREVSFIINNADNKLWLSRRRATVQWDSRLENVLEDEDAEFDENFEDDECLDCTNLEEQDEDEDEEEEILIKKETYDKLLELVNDLKNQLVNEKRDKLVMELKIREEVAKEFSQHFMQRENDFSERLQKEKELMEERCDERIEILQDLVRKCSDEEEHEDDDSKKADLGTDTAVKNDLAAIKKQAVEAHNHIASIHDDPETIAALENKLEQVTSELVKTHEELKRKAADFENYIEMSTRRDLQLEEADKKLSSHRQQIDNLMDMIQEKDTAIEKLKDLISHWEAKCEDYIRGEKEHLNQTIVELKEKLASYEEQITDLDSRNKTMACELQAKKDLALTLEETVEMLKQEIDNNKESAASKVAQIKTIQSKLDDFNKNEAKEVSDAECLNLIDTVHQSLQSSLAASGSCSLVDKIGSGRESAFYNAIEGLWRKCQEVLLESAKKNKQIQHLERELEELKKNMAELHKAKDTLQVNLQEALSQGAIVKENEQLITELQKRLSETANDLERLKKQETDFKNEALLNSQRIKDLESLVDSYREKCEKLCSLEDQSKEKSVAVLSLEKQLADLQAEHMNCEKKHQKLAAENSELELKIKQTLKELSSTENYKNRTEQNISETTKEIKLLKKELSQQASQLKAAQLDLQRKEEDYAELKEKLADAKKQMQQVEKEISSMREEKKALTNKINDHEKQKKQMSNELEIRQRTIQQLSKEQRANEKNGDAELLYQKACQDVKAKEKIIEDMKLTLIEQEQTQEEQEQALEAKVEEAEKLAKEKYSNDRKKWLEEKKTLIAQAKESENHRNKEMRKFAEDRERYFKQQNEMKELSAQLAEKDSTLQNWRNERDTLVSALETQLRNLLSSIAEKEKEIENLKKSNNVHNNEESSSLEEMKKQLAASEATIKELQMKLSELEHKPSSTPTVKLVEKTQTQITEQPESANLVGRSNSKGDSSSTSDVSTSDSQDGSETVLDSSMISTENGKTSRFPKPQMEIRFSPVKPNKMEVKHHGDESPITVRITRTRKRKSAEMEQDNVKNENRKNTRTNKMTPATMASPAIKSSESKKQILTKQLSTSSTSSNRKKDGTLQKLGEFLQSSPSIFQHKAKKFLGTIAAPKTTDLISGNKEEENKPKKSRRKLRKLYTEISAPLDIPAHAILMDNNDKESDHLIMKRRLRTRTAK
uniref:Kinesin motor domain-containing protein n=1 Tax=Pyxicephalus adspersus TaxID=30357 RepID=A0AAV2ZHK6_PYXAD|nr:TPA: hypothetical protein GDO54_004464 [Pyxicephalus adspersus]